MFCSLTLSEELYKAQIFKETMHNERIGMGGFVAIKKIDKSLRKENIAQKDDMVYCVEVCLHLILFVILNIDFIFQSTFSFPSDFGIGIILCRRMWRRRPRFSNI